MNHVSIPIPDGIVDFLYYAVPIGAVIFVIAYLAEALTSPHTK